MSNTTNGREWKYLARKPKSSYRHLFVKGRNVSAWTLWDLHLDDGEYAGRTVEQLAADYDLPVEAVREAIAYMESEPQKIYEDMAREEALAQATELNQHQAAQNTK